MILAAVTGALLLGGCGSEKTKIYEQAGKDLSQGSYKYALEEYQSSIQNGVKLAQSYRGAGIASLRLGKYEDAVNSFTEALNCDKVSKSLRKDILSYRATAELKSGKYEDAMADCQTLGEDFSMDAGSYFLTGKVALAMDSYEEAASNFKQAYGPAGLNPVRRYVRSRTSSGGGQQVPRKAQHLLRPPGRRAA